jgi:hypothetical protein
MAGTFRNRGKILIVQQLSVATESKKVYIPSPLKRWYGIGAQPHLLKWLNLVRLIHKVC